MIEDNKQGSLGQSLIDLEQQQIELARKQLLYSRLTCIFSALTCAFMLAVAMIIHKYVPDISESLHKLENLDRLSEVDFSKLSDAISKLSGLLKNLPFIG